MTYSEADIRKEMELVAKTRNTTIEVLFRPLLLAKRILLQKTLQKDYDEWISSMCELVKATSDKEHNLIYKVLALLHFKYEYEMREADRYNPCILIVSIGLDEARYYYYYENSDMRKQALADFAITDAEAYIIIRKKMQMLQGIMNNTNAWERDRINASKELTKYIDYMIIPDKKNFVFAQNAQIDASTGKQITNNNQVDFSKLPGMDNAETRKELSENVVTIEGEFTKDDG